MVTESADHDDDMRGMRCLVGLLGTHPELMPVAIGVTRDSDDNDVYSRRLAECHPCLRCGCLATSAYLVTSGKMTRWRTRHATVWRWLDVCHYCGSLINTVTAKKSRSSF